MRDGPPVEEIRVTADAEAQAESTARVIADRLLAAVQECGTAGFVLSGGSTPLATYRLLAQIDLPWERIDCFWGDERCVGPDDPASNFGAARRALLDTIEIPVERVHRIHAELGAEEGARDYEERLRACFGGARPEFDVVLLGIGSDGHTASLFPHDTAPMARTWVTPARAPEPPAERVSLTYEALAGAPILFLVSGADKGAIVRGIVEGREDDSPASRIAAAAGSVVWILDRAVVIPSE